MEYPHWLVVANPATEAAPGGYVDEDGVWHDDPAAPAANVAYDGPADVQDKGEVLRTDDRGSAVIISDAIAYLKHEQLLSAIKLGATVVVTWEDFTTSDAEVIQVRRLDGALLLRRL